MKFIPILMSPEMEEAARKGNKTNTRRVMKPQPWYGSRVPGGPHFIFPEGSGQRFNAESSQHGNFYTIQKEFIPRFAKLCPYGKVGDILWVREEHLLTSKISPGDNCETWYCEYKDGSVTSLYAKELSLNTLQRLRKRKSIWKWQRGRFLPKAFCRTFLEVTEVSIERLWEISPGDACDEGIEYWNVDIDALHGGELVADFKNYMWQDDEKYKDYYFPTYADAISSFLSLWEKINGTESREENPWVWVIKFKKISRPENF